MKIYCKTEFKLYIFLRNLTQLYTDDGGELEANVHTATYVDLPFPPSGNAARISSRIT